MNGPKAVKEWSLRNITVRKLWNFTRNFVKTAYNANNLCTKSVDFTKFFRKKLEKIFSLAAIYSAIAIFRQIYSLVTSLLEFLARKYTQFESIVLD